MTELEVIELFSFMLYFADMSDNVPWEEVAEVWRSDETRRKAWREDARELIDLMDSAGLALRVSKTAAAKKSLRRIITRPAQAAYSLSKE